MITEDKRKQWADDARARFENRYERLPSWETGRPQPALVEIAQRDQVGSTLLDAGCGTGENAFFMASLGVQVWGVDISRTAIGMAREKARKRGVEPNRFRVCDALSLEQLRLSFETVIDSGLFHALSDEEREAYLKSVAGVLEVGGSFHILCFSEHEQAPGRHGPRCVEKDDLVELFRAPPWSLLAITRTRFETNIHQGGAEAFLVSVRRVATDQG